MKVLQINNFYPEGSTAKITRDLDSEFKKRGIDSIVLYGHGPKLGGDYHKIINEAYAKFQAVISRMTGVMYGGCVLSTAYAVSIIKKERPDIVHVQCINGHVVNIYRLISWLKKNHVKTVLTNHAEFMYTGNCGHALDCTGYLRGCEKCPRWKKETKSWFFDRAHVSWSRMKKAFDGFSDLTSVSVSPWLEERAKESVILRNAEHLCILNGIDTNIFSYRPDEDDKNPDEKADEKIIFLATAKFSDEINHIKGGYYLIRLAERMRHKNVRFVVAGSCQDGIKVPDNMILLGNISDQNELAKWYSGADLVVLTSRKETFSMIVAESLCCGTPVAGFKAGAPEMICIDEYCSFVDHGDLDALEREVSRLLSAGFDKREIADKAAKKYSKEKMACSYIELYSKLMNKN